MDLLINFQLKEISFCVLNHETLDLLPANQQNYNVSHSCFSMSLLVFCLSWFGESAISH